MLDARSEARALPLVAAAAIALSTLGGCAHTLSGQVGRVVYDGGNDEDDRVWPPERNRNGGPLVGGRLYLPNWRPFALGAEMGLLNEALYPCCQWRVNGLAGFSWLPLERSRVGAEIWAVGSTGSVPVDDDKPWALGIGPRFGLPVRLHGWGWPCADDPVAAATLILAPELGTSLFVPVQGDDHSLQVESVFLLTLSVHVSADDVFAE